MNEKKFVIDSIIKEIRNGMLLHKPIIFLQTAELEIVRRVLESDEVVVRMTKYPKDTMVPFSKIYDSHEESCYGPLIDQRVENMDCCSLTELSKRICQDTDEDSSYGRFAINRKTKYLLPSLLAVHIRENGSPYSDASEFDCLFPFVDRYSRERDNSCAIRSSLVLLYGNPMELPSWLKNYCYIVEEPYPRREEITDIIVRKLTGSGIQLADDTIASYASWLLGNSLIQVEDTVDYLLNLPRDLLTGRPVIENKDEIQKVLSALKEQNVKRSGLLELQKADEEEELGGMDAFKNWLHENEESILEEDWIYRRTGAMRQKGILMCGIPGCGKSAAVNLLEKTLKLPVIKMDIGRLMGGIVGESEHNMHLALRLAEAMSPCIMYIDEIEKGFSGSGGKGEDTSGVTKRMFGILLSWMQDSKKPVYLFATANSLSGIPKEFFRSGRFDSHFALYMPTRKECIDIFKARMRIAEGTVAKYDKQDALFMAPCYGDDNLGSVIDHLLYEEDGKKKGRFITGADITKLVNMGLRQFAQRQGAISHTDWIYALKHACDGTSVYGDGNENLDSIGACYLRMMRLGFKPTSHDSLFYPRDYSVLHEEKGISVSITEKTDFESEYDRVLYHTIREKMLFIASKLEENAIEELIR